MKLNNRDIILEENNNNNNMKIKITINKKDNKGRN